MKDDMVFFKPGVYNFKGGEIKKLGWFWNKVARIYIAIKKVKNYDR